MLNFPSGGGKWSSLSGQAPGGGAAAADGMARIKAKLDELDRVMLEGKSRWVVGLCMHVKRKCMNILFFNCVTAEKSSWFDSSHGGREIRLTCLQPMR